MEVDLLLVVVCVDVKLPVGLARYEVVVFELTKLENFSFLFRWHNLFFCMLLKIFNHFILLHFLKLSFFDAIGSISARIYSIIRVFKSVFLKRHGVTSLRGCKVSLWSV